MAETKKQDGQAFDAEALKAEILERVQEQAEQIIADAKKQAEKVASEATGKPVVVPETAEQIERANELVKLKLFKDRGKYSADVVVIHNGKTWQIKRGVEVEVPRKVYEIVAASERQLGYTADLLDELEEDYESKKDQL